MSGSTFWEKNVIGSTFWEKPRLSAHSWEEHDWQYILGKK
jgi:hypothetical protein